MNVSRESVATALFNLLQQAPYPAPIVFKTISRRYIPFSEVPASQQPALFQLEASQSASQVKGYGLPVWRLKFLVIVLFQAPPNTVPSTMVNNILDGLDAVLMNGGQPQTLGGLVTNCWIDGEVIIDEGLFDSQGLLILPVTVITGA